MPNTNDYPEHLNPFKKRLGIRGSFRELKRSLERTFKRKDEEKRPIEREQIKAVPTRTRHSDSSIATLRENGAHSTAEKSELYPRSRFSERVAKSYGVKNPFVENGKENGEVNPFEEVDSAVKDNNNTESVKKYSKRYRRKKRAPLPPNKTGDSTLTVPSYNSEWSISSYDTDCSSYYCSETEAETLEVKENLKDIAEISTEIINFCKQNEASDDDLKNMPDLVVSAENDAKINCNESVAVEDNSKSSRENISNLPEISSHDCEKNDNSKLDETSSHDCKTNDSSNLHEKNEGELPEASSPDCERNEGKLSSLRDCEKNEGKLPEASSRDCEKNEVKLPETSLDDCEKNDVSKLSETSLDDCEKNDVSKLSETSLDDCEKNDVSKLHSEDCVINNGSNEEEILDICCGRHEEDDQNNNSVLVKSMDEVAISYVESKSLYIAGSKDDLDKVDEVSETMIYITGSRDELNESLKENQPVPKIRKHKLSKAALLGSADEISEVDKL